MLQRTPPPPLDPTASQPPPAPPPLPSSEPALIQRERQSLREILKLVAERAAAEQQTADTRKTSDESADRKYHKARGDFAEKVAGLEITYRNADDERRRAIVDAAISGQAGAKDVFAKASRRSRRNRRLPERTPRSSTTAIGEPPSPSSRPARKCRLQIQRGQTADRRAAPTH